MWKRIWQVSSVAFVCLVGVSVALAQGNTSTVPQENNSQQQKADAQKQNNQSPAGEQAKNEAGNQRNERAFLGVRYGEVSRALSSQLSGSFPHIRHGLLIEDVLPNSPAAKAGLKADDIVTEINNQPIRSPDQLMQDIDREKPGQKIALQVVRESKAENLEVTLGERANMPIVRGQEPEGASGRQSQTSAEAANNQNEASESAENAGVELESFDALSLERTGKDQFKAEIRFRDKQGKIDTRSFQGSREQIRKDIMSQTDLPRSERSQLLGSLRLPMELEVGTAGQQENGQRQGTNAQQTAPEKQNPR